LFRYFFELRLRLVLQLCHCQLYSPSLTAKSTMSFFFRKKRVIGINKKALLFNAGSILDYIALYFLVSTAVEKSLNHQIPTLNEYGFIVVTMLSWLFGLPYEWKLRWARYEGIVYVLAMVLILWIYVSIGISS